MFILRSEFIHFNSVMHEVPFGEGLLHGMVYFS